jgi:protein SCO1
MRSGGKARWAWLLPLFVAVVFVVTAANIYYGFVLLQRKEAGKDRPTMERMPPRELPGFAFTERSGRRVVLDDLRGRVWVGIFFFSSCRGPCPALTLRMKELQDRLADVPAVRLVSFSLDPAVDTPEVLRVYADRYGADAERWWFLTGEEKATHQLSVEGFLSAVQELPVEAQREVGRFVHGTHVALVDREGRMVGAYEILQPEAMDRLEQAVRKLEAGP